jgi:hypothetical protein
MPERTDEKTALLQQGPVIVSEMRLNFDEPFKLNKTIVTAILGADTDVLTKAGLLARILPGLVAAGNCACSCSCSCSCSCTCGSEALTPSLTPQTGRV